MVPATATFIFCDGHLLVRAGELEPAGAATLAELRRTRAVLDEFTVRPRGDLAVAVSGAAETPPPGCEWVRLRALIGAEAPRAGPACRALGMVNWRATHRFCGRCGGPLAEHPADAAGTCAACGQVEYPSLAPAVIETLLREPQHRLDPVLRQPWATLWQDQCRQIERLHHRGAPKASAAR